MTTTPYSSSPTGKAWDGDIRQARPRQASAIASLIMQAMDYDCCRYFAGEHHTLDDFHRLMTTLVAADNSQYSWRNTLVALAKDGTVAGICTSYDGARLHELRQAFIREALLQLGRDFSGIADETESGELYIDSLAVDVAFRRQGIATALLKATAQKAKDMNIPRVGLLVDTGNPTAEHLYTAVGFNYAGDSAWGGHPMRHLQMEV